MLRGFNGLHHLGPLPPGNQEHAPFSSRVQVQPRQKTLARLMEKTLSSVATTGVVGAQNAQAEEAVMAQPELGSVDAVP